MQFSHLIQINDPFNPLIDPLSREQLWRGLVLRALNNYGLPHSLRMTIGTEEANRLVVDGLRDFMAGK